MNKLILKVLPLLIICAVAALALGVANALTAPEIARLENDAKAGALKSLTNRGSADPEKEYFLENNKDISSYFIISENDQTIGYILYLNAKGYGGPMKVMASYSENGAIIDVKLMANQETPGFGKNAEKAGYMDMYKNRGSVSNPIPLFTYEVENVDIVTGATITFMGISDSLKIGSDFIKEGLK